MILMVRGFWDAVRQIFSFMSETEPVVREIKCRRPVDCSLIDTVNGDSMQKVKVKVVRLSHQVEFIAARQGEWEREPEPYWRSEWERWKRRVADMCRYSTANTRTSKISFANVSTIYQRKNIYGSQLPLHTICFENNFLKHKFLFFSVSRYCFTCSARTIQENMFSPFQVQFIALMMDPKTQERAEQEAAGEGTKKKRKKKCERRRQ